MELLVLCVLAFGFFCGVFFIVALTNVISNKITKAIKNAMSPDEDDEGDADEMDEDEYLHDPDFWKPKK